MHSTAMRRARRIWRRGWRAAMSLATSRVAGLKLQFGSDAKAVHAGTAAQSGLEAALLAQSGLSASPRVWDAAGGLLDLYGDGNTPGFSVPPLNVLTLTPG